MKKLLIIISCKLIANIVDNLQYISIYQVTTIVSDFIDKFLTTFLRHFDFCTYRDKIMQGGMTGSVD